jgi:Flp pilus assembly protein TadG
VRTTISSARTTSDSDRGSVTLELAILAPVLIIALLFVIAAGRIAQAHQAVEAAARDAARQASIARDPTTARANATSSAQAALLREGMSCPAEISVDTSGFARPVGRPATVTARVTCTVHLADVAAGGIADTTITASFTSPIDPYRGRNLGLNDLGAAPAAYISAVSA